MRFKIEASDGEVLTGQIPDDWGKVPFLPYIKLAATAQAVPASIEPTAHVFASVAGCTALAELLGLATAEPLLKDMSLLLPIYEAAPWLFLGQLPDAEALVTSFTHDGVDYSYLGGLDGANGGQMEALLTFLKEADGNFLHCGPQLLAVLYGPTGKPQTAKAVQVAAQAFESLPMDIAWPCLQNFWVRSMPLALPIQRYLALRPMVEQAVGALEQLVASPGSALRGRSSNMRHWLAKTWVRLVKQSLVISSSHSAFTGQRPSWLTRVKLRFFYRKLR